MQIKTFGAAVAALSLAAGAGPALAGGYWDGGNPAINGGGWCPPPPPPPCDCPPRYGYAGPPPYGEAPPPGYGDEGPPPGYDDDQGFAPSELFEGDVGGPDVYAADDFGGGFVGGGPVVGVGFGFGFRDRGDRSFDERRRFGERQRFSEQQSSEQRVSVRERVQAHVSVQQHVMQGGRSYAHATGGRGRW